jgi:TonB family protein
MHELSGSYQRHASIALGFAITLHLLVVAIYYVFCPSFPVVQTVTSGTTIIFSDPLLLSLKTFSNLENKENTGSLTHVRKIDFAIPVPVSVDELTLDEKVARQKNLDEFNPGLPGDEKGKGSTEGSITTETGELDPSPGIFIPVEHPPVPIKEVVPQYPDIARRAGVEGTVWINVLVDKQGRAKRAMIIKSDAEVLSESAIQAALQWLFTPAMMSNGPVTVWASIPFRFKLNK